MVRTAKRSSSLGDVEQGNIRVDTPDGNCGDGDLAHELGHSAGDRSATTDSLPAAKAGRQDDLKTIAGEWDIVITMTTPSAGSEPAMRVVVTYTRRGSSPASRPPSPIGGG